MDVVVSGDKEVYSDKCAPAKSAPVKPQAPASPPPPTHPKEIPDAPDAVIEVGKTLWWISAHFIRRQMRSHWMQCYL